MNFPFLILIRKMLLIILGYTIVIFVISFFTSLSIKSEFFIAIFIVFFYFLFALWVLKLSLNKKDPTFLKIFFWGMGIRILLTVMILLILAKLNFNILAILLFMIPIYFVVLMMEVIEINKIAKQMESSV